MTAIMSLKKEEEFLLFLIRHNGGQGGHLPVPDSSKYKFDHVFVALGKARTRSIFLFEFLDRFCRLWWPEAARQKTTHIYIYMCMYVYMCTQATAHHTTPHRARPHRATPRHTTPNHTGPNHTAANHTSPNQTTPNHTTPNQTKPPSARKVKIAPCVLYLSGKLHWAEETSDRPTVDLIL